MMSGKSSVSARSLTLEIFMYSRNEIMLFCDKVVATKAAKETPVI